MKLKNTLGVVIGSLVAATSFGALAQGQGAVEVEGFVNRYFADTQRDFAHDEGNLFGGSIGYYLTDDVELALSYGEYHDLRGEGAAGSKNIKGNLSDLKAIYHFGQPGPGLRPYVSAGFGHQSIGDANDGGRDHSTLAIAGAGAKYYFTEMFYARAGVDALYNIDQGDTEWQAGVGVGLNFGGGSKPAPAPEPVAAAPEPMPEPAPEPATCQSRVAAKAAPTGNAPEPLPARGFLWEGSSDPDSSGDKCPAPARGAVGSKGGLP